MDNQKFFPAFIQIPYQLIIDNRLTPADRIVFGVVYWYQKLKDGRCFASNKSIAEVANIQPGSVQNCLDRLELNGFIKRIHNNSKTKKGQSRQEIQVLIDYKSIPLNNGIQESIPLDNGIQPSSMPLDNGHNKNNNNNNNYTDSKESTKSSSKEEKEQIKKEDEKSPVYLETKEYIEKTKDKFSDEKFNFPDKDGNFDWRYLLDHGKRLSPTKFFVIKYLERKEKLSDGIFKYKFKYKYAMDKIFKDEMKYAKQLANMYSVKDFDKLIEFVDSETWDEKTRSYKFEYKLSTLVKYAAKFNGQNE